MDDNKLTPGEFASKLVKDGGPSDWTSDDAWSTGWPEDLKAMIDWMANAPEEWQPHLELPDQLPGPGTYTMSLATGQKLWMTVDESGQLIERGYTDRGDVHFEDVKTFIKGWLKTIEKQSGPPAGLQKGEQRKQYDKIMWMRDNTEMTNAEIAQALRISTSTLYNRINDHKDVQ